MINISDVLERITKNRIKRHWTYYQLSETSGVPQSTISSWYNQGMTPNIATLEKICNAFGMTFCQFFAEETECYNPSPTQRELLAKWCLLTPKQQQAFLHLMDTINLHESSHDQNNDRTT